MARYDNLVRLVGETKPRRIMEIGVYNGQNSKNMIREAVKHRSNVEFWGFDLFEVEKGSREEFIKVPPSIETVGQTLRGENAKVHLIKGNTLETLKDKSIPQMDFIFIDGGHSFETVESDWHNVQRLMHNKTIVIFDDYWTGPALTDPHWSQGGCKPLIDNLEGYSIEFLEPTDKFKHLWSTLVKVTQ